jgi:hypothetical protein
VSDPWFLLDLSDDRRDKKPWLPEDDWDVSNGLVVLDSWSKPACALHGAMNRVSAEPGPVRIYRCSEMRCGVGGKLVEMIHAITESLYHQLEDALTKALPQLRVSLGEMRRGEWKEL